MDARDKTFAMLTGTRVGLQRTYRVINENSKHPIKLILMFHQTLLFEGVLIFYKLPGVTSRCLAEEMNWKRLICGPTGVLFGNVLDKCKTKRRKMRE